jgi:hypothetical protein
MTNHSVSAGLPEGKKKLNSLNFNPDVPLPKV